jgi:multidrug resistance efflux pump
MRKAHNWRYGRKLAALKKSPAAVAAARANELVAAAEARVAVADWALAACAVTAQGPGRLAELRVRPGMKVRPGQSLALVEETGAPRMVFEAPAALRARLAVGQRALVAVADAEGTGEKGFAAAITQIVAAGESAIVYLQPLGSVSVPAAGTALTARLQ